MKTTNITRELPVIRRKGIDKSLLEWEPVSSHLIRARLRGRHNNITLTQCYAPTNDREDTDKDALYDLTIVTGDLNAKVGSDKMYCDKPVGKHRCCTRNKNGDRLD